MLKTITITIFVFLNSLLAQDVIIDNNIKEFHEKNNYTEKEKEYIIVAREVYEKMKLLTQELSTNKDSSLKKHRLFKDHYSLTYDKKLIENSETKKENKETKSFVICNNDSYLFDFPIKECFNYKNFNYKDVDVSKLTNVLVQFTIPFERKFSDIFLQFEKNKNNKKIKTIISVEGNQGVELNYEFKNKNFNTDGLKNKDLLKNVYQELIDNKEDFIITETFVEILSGNEFNKNKYETLDEYLNLDNNYNRIIEQRFFCVGHNKCFLEYEFIANNSLINIVKLFYEINQNEDLVKAVFKPNIDKENTETENNESVNSIKEEEF